jgi:hypothetical protein
MIIPTLLAVTQVMFVEGSSYRLEQNLNAKLVELEKSVDQENNYLDIEKIKIIPSTSSTAAGAYIIYTLSEKD